MKFTAKEMEAIEKAQSRCSTRTITVEDIESSIEDIEEFLIKLIPKKNWLGIEIQINLHLTEFPNAYKYAPEGTIVEIKKISNRWKIVGAWRGYCNGNPNKKYTISEMSDEQKKQITDSIQSKLWIFTR